MDIILELICATENEIQIQRYDYGFPRCGRIFIYFVESEDNDCE